MPDWRLTQHAVDRMQQYGLERAQVIACLERPTLTYPGADEDAASMVVHCGDITVVFNPETFEVITVHKKETPVSGWINLTAKEAEKLLGDWGFEVKRRKPQAKLWGHPLDTENRLIPFTDPAASTRENGKSSYRIAAQVVGVPVNDFLRGPTTEWFARNLRKLGNAVVDESLEAPDPLGLQAVSADQRLTQLGRAAIATMDREKQAREAATAQSSLTTLQQHALDAITGEALTSSEVAVLVGCHPRTAQETLVVLEERGLAVRRQAAAGELPGKGRPPWLYLAGAFGTEIPTRQPVGKPLIEVLADVPDLLTDPAPEETPMPAQPARDQALHLEAVAVSGFNPDDVQEAPRTSPRIFEEAGIPWPAGGILITDHEGNLYVARKLTEEGR